MKNSLSVEKKAQNLHFRAITISFLKKVSIYANVAAPIYLILNINMILVQAGQALHFPQKKKTYYSSKTEATA